MYQFSLTFFFSLAVFSIKMIALIAFLIWKIEVEEEWSFVSLYFGPLF